MNGCKWKAQRHFILLGYRLINANSRYLGVNIGLGARWSRTELVTQFIGEHAECDLQGLYLAGDGQLMDYHLDVTHAIPNCNSRENFKGILYGKGRAVFDGRVLVAKDAQKSDAAMSNNNLMLSEGAEVDTKPQLEINADDVKCSHGTQLGSSTGKVVLSAFAWNFSTVSAANAVFRICWRNYPPAA
ncbi:SufD family Fe-S cluster assembly protein [Chromatium okenii]|uniref:SufD family Fe-S cluster assembly protein n=1 Tax=Chromatium okenii TaxID=61644 RepID=UPI00241308EB|nr:SufD family Fe-S cluster assembly protein [Chromatium okenii]